MCEKYVRRPTASRFLAAFGAALLLGACAAANAPENIDAAYGLSVAAQVDMARPLDQAARCLVERQNAGSYPWGVGPGYTSTETYDDTVYLTQWFFIKRGMTWTTRLALHSSGEGATQVEVLLPVEHSTSEHYLRAALEVIARCQPASASAK